MKIRWSSIKKKIIPIFALITIFFYFIMSNYTENGNRLLAIILIVVSIDLVIKNRNVLCVFLSCFFIAYANYSIAMGVYLTDIAPSYLFGQIVNQKYYVIGLISLILFTSFISLMDIPSYYSFDNLEIKEENLFLALILEIIAAIIIFLFFLNSNVAIGSSLLSTIYEYLVIIFLLIFHYSNKNRILMIIYFLEMLVYIFQVFANGDRASALVLIFAYIFYHFRGYKNYLKVLPILFGCVFFMIALGHFRDLSKFLDIKTSLNEIFSLISDSWLTFDTAIWAYFPSIISIELHYTNDIFTRLRDLFSLSLYLITGSFGNAKHLNTMIIATNYFQAGGYVSVTYFFYYLGWLGNIFISSIVTIYYKLTNINKKNNLYFFILIYFFSTVPRWYLYGIFTLFRGMLFMIISYFLIKLLYKTKKFVR